MDNKRTVYKPLTRFSHVGPVFNFDTRLISSVVRRVILTRFVYFRDSFMFECDFVTICFFEHVILSRDFISCIYLHDSFVSTWNLFFPVKDDSFSWFVYVHVILFFFFKQTIHFPCYLLTYMISFHVTSFISFKQDLYSGFIYSNMMFLMTHLLPHDSFALIHLQCPYRVLFILFNLHINIMSFLT